MQKTAICISVRSPLSFFSYFCAPKRPIIMKKISLFLAVAALFSFSASAQAFKTSAPDEQSLEDVFDYQVFKGDLNKDGIEDLVAYIYKEIDLSDDTPDVFSTLAIYWGAADGYLLYRQYDSVLFGTNRAYFAITENTISVTPKGLLRINVDVFNSAGSYESYNHTYLFRFQDGDFYLIGDDSHVFSRNFGETTETSTNYLTNKQKVTNYNEFDESIKRKVVWNDIPKEPLRSLGSFPLIAG